MNQTLKINRMAPSRTSSAVTGVLVFATCLSAAVATGAAAQETIVGPPHEAGVANVAYTSNATSTSPGYLSLKAGNYNQARNYIKVTNSQRPNDAFDELNLGDAYQHLGRMDLAEPLFRSAMTHGHGLHPVETTTGMSPGKTVEEIACQNLARGLKPASVAGTASPCQTTLVISFSEPPVVGAPIHARTSFNTYFEFDKATLTPEGREIVDDAARQAARSDPRFQVYLIGKADSVGTSSYNWQLSRARANTVRNELIAEGLASSRINIRWVGETQLPVAEAEGMQEPLNRVVEGDVQQQ